jgi:hypothetical protein
MFCNGRSGGLDGLQRKTQNQPRCDQMDSAAERHFARLLADSSQTEIGADVERVYLKRKFVHVSELACM